MRTRKDPVRYSDDPFRNVSWEVTRFYNGFGELIGLDEHGLRQTYISRDFPGRPYRIDRSGETSTWLVPGSSGETLVWFDDDGNTGFRTWDPQSLRATDGSMNVATLGNGIRSTSSIVDYDATGSPVFSQRVGHFGEVRARSFINNGLGWPTQSYDADGRWTLHEYNALGWPTGETVESSGSGDVTDWTYDRNGRVVSRTEPNGEMTQFEFTAYGELAREYRPGATMPFVVHRRDHLGRLVQTENASGEILDLHYNPGTADLAEVRWANSPGGDVSLKEFSYDDQGRRWRAVSANPSSAHFGSLSNSQASVETHRSFDELDRVTSETLFVGTANGRTTTASYAYTGDGVMRSLVYPSGRSIEEAYDGQGRLESLGGTGLTGPIDFFYQGHQQIEREHHWDDLAQADPLREFATLNGFGERNAWEWTAVDLDQNGDPTNGPWSNDYCGAWDPSRCAGPLLSTHVKRGQTGRIGSVETRFGHPMSIGGSPLPDSDHLTFWRGYTYDAQHHLDGVLKLDAGSVDTSSLLTHQMTRNDVENFGASVGATRYDRFREPTVGGLEEISAVLPNNDVDVLWSGNRTAGHRLAQVEFGGTPRTVTHDASGRMTVDGEHRFTYGPEHRLATTEHHASQQLKEVFLYDGFGRLAAIHDVANAGVTHFDYDGFQKIAASDPSGNLRWEAVWGGQDQLVEWTDIEGTGDRYVPLVDHRNSVVATWNASTGALDAIAEYNVEGRLTLRNDLEAEVCTEVGTAATVCSNPSGIPFGFNSMWRSPTTGLVYMRNRWYSPRLAQFTTHDPLGAVDSTNLYAFAGFDPINRWDPWGLKAEGHSEPPGAPGCRHYDVTCHFRTSSENAFGPTEPNESPHRSALECPPGANCEGFAPNGVGKTPVGAGAGGGECLAPCQARLIREKLEKSLDEASESAEKWNNRRDRRSRIDAIGYIFELKGSVINGVGVDVSGQIILVRFRQTDGTMGPTQTLGDIRFGVEGGSGMGASVTPNGQRFVGTYFGTDEPSSSNFSGVSFGLEVEGVASHGIGVSGSAGVSYSPSGWLVGSFGVGLAAGESFELTGGVDAGISGDHKENSHTRIDGWELP